MQYMAPFACPFVWKDLLYARACQRSSVLLFEQHMHSTRGVHCARDTCALQDLTSVRIIDIEGITETPQETSGNVAAQQEARAA